MVPPDLWESWLNAHRNVRKGEKLFLTFNKNEWYANIQHPYGYVVWYMNGLTPKEALDNLTFQLDLYYAENPERKEHDPRADH